MQVNVCTKANISVWINIIKIMLRKKVTEGYVQLMILDL